MYPKKMGTILIGPNSDTLKTSSPAFEQFTLEDAVTEALQIRPLNRDLLAQQVRPIAQSRGMGAYSDSTLDLVLQRLVHLGQVRIRDFEFELAKK